MSPKICATSSTAINLVIRHSAAKLLIVSILFLFLQQYNPQVLAEYMAILNKDYNSQPSLLLEMST